MYLSGIRDDGTEAIISSDAVGFTWYHGGLRGTAAAEHGDTRDLIQMEQDPGTGRWKWRGADLKTYVAFKVTSG